MQHFLYSTLLDFNTHGFNDSCFQHTLDSTILVFNMPEFNSPCFQHNLKFIFLFLSRINIYIFFYNIKYLLQQCCWAHRSRQRQARLHREENSPNLPYSFGIGLLLLMVQSAHCRFGLAKGQTTSKRKQIFWMQTCRRSPLTSQGVQHLGGEC